jgi:hypothetical protein
LWNFLPHIVKGEGLETSQFVFYSPVLGNLNTISLNLKIKSAVAYSRSSTINLRCGKKIIAVAI